MIELESCTGNRTTTLYNAQTDRRTTQAETDVGSPLGFFADETILSQFESLDEFTLSGTVTGIYLSNLSKYPNDPLEAIGKYALELETYVDSHQGSEQKLHDDERGLTISGVLRSVGWQRDAGAKYELQWDIEFIRGEGLMPCIDSTVGQSNPQSVGTLDGNDLGEMSSWRMDKRQDFQPYKVAFAQPGENLLEAQSGAVRRFTIRGQQTDAAGGGDERNTFDDNIRSIMGQNQSVTFVEPLTGRNLTVMVDSFESSREAGLTSIGEYNMELIQGDVAGAT